MTQNESIERALLGGGCFWCLEAVFAALQGVHRVQSGYAGGAGAAPRYEEVCRGTTGHAEVVQIEFDPQVIGYRDLLEIFFAIHDPTTPNRQGHDVGTQYRSVIFYDSPAQQAAAQQLIAELTAQRVFSAPIVTELAASAPFWPAEPEHQEYYRRNPRQSYCQVVIAPKLADFRRRFAARLRTAD